MTINKPSELITTTILKKYIRAKRKTIVFIKIKFYGEFDPGSG